MPYKNLKKTKGKTIKNIFIASFVISLLLLLIIPIITYAIPVLQIIQGGTSTSTAPTYGQLLVGNSGGTYTLTATSSLGITGASADWLKQTNYGVLNLTASTTIPYWAKDAFYASSTSVFQGLATFGNASTSQISVSNYLDYIGTTLDTGVNTGTARLQAVTDNGITRLIHLSETGIQKVVNQDNVFKVKNTSGGTITAGQIVYVTGSTGVVPNIALAKADALGTASPTVGVVVASITNNSFGEIMLNGIVDNIDTSSFTAGDNVFVSTTTAGALTNLRATYPNYTKGIGIVLNSGVGNGSILVNVAPFLGGIESGTTADTYVFGGNVGIGTTSPYAKLSVVGETVAEKFTATSTTATSTFNGNAYVKGNLQVDGNFFAPVQLVSSGNATINGTLTVTGATTLATSLTGALSASSGVVSAGTLSVANGGTGLSSGYNNTNWDTAYTNRITSATYPLTISSNAISLAFGTTTSNTWAGTQTFGTIANTGGYTQSGTSANTFTGLTTLGNASTTQIGSTGSAYFATSGGNVGIGTTTPSNLLNVYSNLNNTTAARIRIDNNNNTGTAAGSSFVASEGIGTSDVGLYYLNSGLATSGTNVASGGVLVTGTGATGGLTIRTNANAPIMFATNGIANERMRITEAGNVGIGTTSPEAKLDVKGGALVVDGTDNMYGGLKIDTDTSGDYHINFRSGRQTITNNGGFRWFMGARPSGSGSWGTGTEVMFLTNAGNLGIGTTSPWRTLSVTGTVGFGGLTSAIGAGSLCLDSNKQVVYNSASDACLSSTRITKHDITKLDLSGISLINKLEPSSFVYNQGDGRTRYGFMAEDTALVDDRLATHNEKGDITGIDDRAILSVAVKAVQELSEKVKKQNNEIKELKAEIMEIKKWIKK